MKKILLLAITAFAISAGYAQNDKFWSSHKGDSGKMATDKAVSRLSFPKQFDLYELNLDHMQQTLVGTQNRSSNQKVIITLPNVDGGLEQFEMYEASNFDPELQAQFPEIRAYSGKGITDKYATLKLSISPQGIQTMVFRTDKPNEFIEAYSQDHRVYAVFKSQREKGKMPWTCSVKENEMFAEITPKAQSFAGRASDGKLKTLRLAQSVTAEYSAFFGASTAGTTADKSLVLAAINNTLTRCNGVYEKDLGLHLNLVANNTNILYFNPSTDPYSPAAQGLTDIAGCTSAYNDCPGTWNTQLQSTLTSVIGEANYDIGHLFGASGGGGNAGCIGCVCDDLRPSDSSPSYQRGKGEGITSPFDDIPMGDNFDIDFVVHEIGHQLGASHTFTMGGERSGANMEVGSGITVMGYAGITNQDIAAHSIDVYHAVSISQIQSNLNGKTCPVTTNIGANNATPVAQAGSDYTIPKSTPFKLTGNATDANAGDALTYSWEQFDYDSASQTGSASGASSTKTVGPNWRSYSPTASKERYFPVMSSVLVGSTTTLGQEIAVEALSSVARQLKFRLTVRDNSAYSTSPVKVGQTSFDDMIVTVDDTKGPLAVTSQKTNNISWPQGSTQTITWAVNNTNTINGGNNVDILLSTDGGQTFTTSLATGIPNNGSATITVPNIAAPNCRIMVKASGNIFFNVNMKPIAIGYSVTSTCTDYVKTFSPAQAMTTGWSGYAFPAITDNYTVSSAKLKVVSTAALTNQVSFAIVKPNSNFIEVVAFDGPTSGCTSTSSNLDALFDDEGAPFNCAATNTGATYAPRVPLYRLDGLNYTGTWYLAAKSTITTNKISSATLTLCRRETTPLLSTDTFGLQDFTLYPNPNNGNFNVQFTSNTSNEIKIGVHDLRGRLVFENGYENTATFRQNIQLNNVQAGIYIVTVQDGDKKETKKIVIR
ncbi:MULTISPECIES: zinc-dependent metalloprotease [Flavobacterium]|uniref:zinc-dependent metalloprotease n=1 Tax=Flavobacterium TaxID=237 RepID=UPI001FCB0942|nr:MULTISPECIES: zinc-dependent metalloprotease [Flavobacterium]UOK42990.1 T9SS type A sorting domain-containing protein [Flavobacterium enshiense]